ncbi:PH domain-containing protein [Alteromonas sp. ASW11-36]|uniref:PH domain-containing protein n=1 Tax=Alteromonas arenosi TaxID=3055817 RepID=A0ABT7SZ51_9ALTE|nr:PH domain-containing protein [Alteromonas sp. ASW11-36]MDM7861462.1 PH domain-containing protein [Alteromonas sp. ASW11-36]
MGLLDKLMGNASEVDAGEVQEELAPVLADSERVTQAFKLVRDMFVFTNARLIFIDKQGMTGKKVEYHSVPYRAITQFNVETAGHFDMDAELTIWISGQSNPLKVELNKETAIGLQKSLANAMFG